jgi:hypothetical protein
MPMTSIKVILHRNEKGIFRAQVLQDHRLGPNLCSKACDTHSKAEEQATRKIRQTGWTGPIEWESGTNGVAPDLH